MEIVTVTYKYNNQIQDESFSSDEQLQQWIENYPEYTILEITYDTLD